MSYTSMLIDTCTFETPATGAQDAYGHPAITWSDLLVDEACRLNTVRGVELKIGANVVVINDVLFVGDISVTEQDRVTVGGILYDILLVKTMQDSVGTHHKELYLKAHR